MKDGTKLKIVAEALVAFFMLLISYLVIIHFLVSYTNMKEANMVTANNYLSPLQALSCINNNCTWMYPAACTASHHIIQCNMDKVGKMFANIT